MAVRKLPKVLMVDVDGVLVNGRPSDGRHWCTSLMDDLGIDPSALQEYFFARHFADVIVGRADLKEKLAPILEEIAPNVDVETLVNYWLSQDSRVNRRLFDDLAAIRTRGVSIQVATNQEHLRASYLMSQLRLGEIADAIHYSADLGWTKPDQRFFALACERAGVDASEILFLDDMAANVDAARRAGWRGFLWSAGSTLAGALESQAVAATA